MVKVNSTQALTTAKPALKRVAAKTFTEVEIKASHSMASANASAIGKYYSNGFTLSK